MAHFQWQNIYNLFYSVKNKFQHQLTDFQKSTFQLHITKGQLGYYIKSKRQFCVFHKLLYNSRYFSNAMRLPQIPNNILQIIVQIRLSGTHPLPIKPAIHSNLCDSGENNSISHIYINCSIYTPFCCRSKNIYTLRITTKHSRNFNIELLNHLDP